MPASPADKSRTQHARKFVFIGASYRFDHRVIRDFLLARRFNGSTFVIVDLDNRRLKLVTDLLRKMVRQSRQEITVEGTLDMDHALRRADFVFSAFSVGGDDAWERDAAIAWRYGIVQPSADTTGPAGLARALRDIPLAVDVAHRLQRLSPKARLINLASPMSTITGAMAHHSELPSVLGTSHAVEGVRGFLARLYKVPATELELATAGVNRLSWVLQVLIDGHDQTDRLDALLSRAVGTKTKVADIEEQKFALSLRVWRRYGFLPVSGDEHICEFFAPFSRRGSREAARFKPFKPGNRRKKLEAKLETWAYGKDAVPDMDQWSGEDVAGLVLAMLDDNNSRHTVNMPHDGALGHAIASGAIVECMATVDKRGAKGVALGELPTVVGALTQRMNAVHTLTIEAAMEGDRKKAVQALLLDPSVTDFDRVPALVDDYVKAFRNYLPRFWR